MVLKITCTGSKNTWRERDKI